MDLGATREYRLKGRYRHFYFGLGLFLGLIGLALAGWAMSGDPDPGVRSVALAGALALVLLGGSMMLSMSRFRIVLTPDAIERHGLFGVNRLEREDIAGRRSIPLQHGPPMTRLESRRSRRHVLAIPVELQTDEHLTAWLQSLPDIDLQEAQTALDEYLQAEGGGSAEEKRARLLAVFRIARPFNFIGIGLLLWAMVYPHPYELVLGINVLMPFVVLALAMWGGQACTLNPKSNDIRVGLLVPLLLPGVTLALRALFDINLLDWRDALTATLVATAIFMLLAWLLVASLRQEGVGILTLALLMTSYGYGASAVLNRQLDRNVPQVFAVKVIDMRMNSGKSTTYHLKLAPWGPRTEAEEVDVRRALYHQVRKGDTVCVYLSPGALAMPWFDVGGCRN